MAYLNGKRTEVNTQSYFCDRAYSLPIISVVSDPSNFWDYSRGLYVKGCCADTIEPYMGANFWKSWEYACNVEMYDENGEICFNQQAGMSIFGGFSRALPQKSLAIIARSKYGNNRFDYPIFKQRKHKKYKSFIIRNSGGDFQRTQLRDAFMTQMAKPTGIAIQEYEPAIIFINGQYWGIENIREKINEHYLHQNYGVDKNNVDILRHNRVARHGSSRNYKYLLNYLRTHDLSIQKNVDELKTFMDVDDYIRYNICEVYSDNRDAGGNIRYFRERTDSAQWRWVFYDLDLGLGNNDYDGYKRNTLLKFTSPNVEAWPDPAWSTFIIRKLLENPNLRFQYVTTTCDYLNTVFHPDTALALLDRMAKRIETEMPYHTKRWETSVKNWHFHLDVVREFIKNRPTYLHQHLKEKFGLGKQIQVKIIYPDTNNCKIKFNTLHIKQDFNGTYYENIPLHISVNPKHDYEFVGWKNREETEASISFVPNSDVVLEPIIRPKKPSEFKDSLIINEIAFYQPDSIHSKDWIELYNRSGEELVLDGFVITDDTYKKGFKLPENTKIKADDYLIVCENTTLLFDCFMLDTSKVIGGMDFGLSKKGEKLKLYDSNGFMVDSLRYLKKDKKADSLFTISMVHPDSSRYLTNHWIIESPTPLMQSNSYSDLLYQKQRNELWKKRLYLGGGGFFFICLLGTLWFLFIKKRKNKKTLT